MALALFDRVQETSTTAGTGSIVLAGAVSGFQSFAVVGNGNTCYYTIVDGSAWEVGVGTYSTSGPTLARTTILSNSNGNTSPLTLTANSKSVFLTYPASKSVNLNESGNVSPLGTVVSGIWNGTTIGVAYGGTGVTASSGANSVVLRDSNQNITVNRINQGIQTITASGGTTVLTAASQFNQALVGTGGHTFRLPDATTLTDTTTFQFNNNATGTLTIQNNAGTTVGSIASGGAAGIALLSNATVGGTWDVHAYIPENVTWGTNALTLGSTVISGGTWQGGTIATGYGGTGLTSYTSGGAVYANSSSTLTSGTLPLTAGGTAATSAAGARTSLDVPSTTGSGASGTWGINITGNAATATNSTTTSQTNFSNLTIGGSQVLYAGNYNSYAPTLTGGGASGTWGVRITGFANQGSQRLYSIDGSYNYDSANPYFGYLTYNGAANRWRFKVSPATPDAVEVAYADAAGSAGSADYANLTNKTGGTGTYTTSGDYRAPIFYDSNNTAYYIDPNSTGTSMNAAGNITIGNGSANTGLFINYGGGSGDYAVVGRCYQAGSNNQTIHVFSTAWQGGTLQSTSAGSINLSGANGVTMGAWNNNDMWIDISGNSQSRTSSRAPIFYDSNDTAYYVDPASTTRIRRTNLIASGSGWDDGLNLYSSDASNRWNLLVDQGASNWLRFAYNQSEKFYIRPDGAVIATTDIRAPIFYDSDDTSYYVSPNGNSKLVNLGLGGVTPDVRLSVSGDGHITSYLYQGGTAGSSGSWSSRTYSSGGATYINTNTFEVNRTGYGGNAVFWTDTSENTFSQSSHRAPIFYDRNNTSYYVDPASTSLLNSINVYGGGLYDSQTGFRLTLPGGAAYVTSASVVSGAIKVRLPPASLGSNTMMGFDVDVYTYDSQSFTIRCGGYNYGDGGKTWYNVFAYMLSGNRAALNVRFGWDGTSQCIWIGELGSSWSYPQVGVSNFVGGYSGFNAANFASGWTVSFETSSFYSVSNSVIVYPFPYYSGQSATLYSSDSMRSPIFYDLNNTAYYLDAASTSRINSITYDNLYFSGDTTYGLIGRNGYLDTLNGRGSDPLELCYYDGGNVIIGAGASKALFASAVYATIFYDNNNTGYYLDPTSTTALRTVGSWRADSASWDGEFNGKIQYHANQWYSQSLSGWNFRNSGGSNVVTIDSSGNLVASGNVTAYSDARIKENVVTIDAALDKVLRLRGVYYNKIGNPERRVGVIAQETEPVLPEVVRSVSDTNPSTGETTELLAVDYGNITGLLIEATKEQNKEVVDLRNRVAQLESLINKLIGG